MKPGRSLCLVVLSVVMGVYRVCAAGEPIDISDRLELFVDSHLIERMDKTELKLHQPVLAAPLTGDVDSIEYGTVMKDGERYRLYTRDRFASKKDGDGGEYTRYFESADGKHWVAPDLDLIPVAGSGWRNVILHDPPYCHNFSPMLDVRPGVPQDERYKALSGMGEHGLKAFVSGDGVRWRSVQDEPVLAPGAPWDHKFLYDSQNVSFWSESENQYVCYFRSFDGVRRIGRAVSDDYRNWRKEKLLNVNEEGEHLYTSQTHPYFRAPHIYLALPTRYYPDRGSSTDILFMSARGNGLYSRPFKQAFIRPGLDPARWGNRSNYAALNVVPTGATEMSLYTSPFRRFVLRTDGFVSIHADAEGGTMITRPLLFSGEKLLVNYATSAGGSLRVALLDSAGIPHSGYEMDACERMVGDAINQNVVWRDSAGLSALVGSAIRLEIELIDGDLYSIQFQD